MLELNKHVYVIDENIPAKFHPNFFKIHAKDYQKIETIANDIIPDAVIASSEKSVLTAARLRKKFDLFGESLETAILCTNKLKMKERATELGIPITKYQYIKNGIIQASDIEEFRLPIVIKSLDESGGRNTEYILDPTTLYSRYIENQLLESFVTGFECSVETIVQNGKIIFTNITTYTKKYSQNILPSSLGNEIEARVRKYNQIVIEGFGIKNSLCHAEFYIDKEAITFGEIAIRPPGGYIMHLLELSYGKDFWQIYSDLLLGKDVSKDLDVPHNNYSAVWIIHPGEGKVKFISGWDKITQLKYFAGGKLKLKVGDICQKRLGSGQDYGYIFFVAKSPELLIKQLESAENLLQIGIENDLAASTTN